MRSKAQSKLQLIPRVGISVRSQLITPSPMVLRASKALRLIGREKFYSGAVGQDYLAVVAVPSLEHFIAAKDTKNS